MDKNKRKQTNKYFNKSLKCKKKRRKQVNIKLEKYKLNSFLIIRHFLIFINTVLHTQKKSEKITQLNL